MDPTLFDSLSADELSDLELSLGQATYYRYGVPESPEEVSYYLALRLDLENALGVLALYRDLEGRSVSGGFLSSRLGVSRELLEVLCSTGELIGIHSPFEDGYLYPSWQFDSLSGDALPGLVELSKAASGVGMDAMSLDGFMTNLEAGDGTPPATIYRAGPDGRRTVLEWLLAARSVGS